MLKVTGEEVALLQNKAETGQGFDQGDYSVIVRMCHDLVYVHAGIADTKKAMASKKRSHKKKT